MIQWSNSPPSPARGVPLRLTRTPARRPLVAVVTSADFIGTNTHFFMGRTIPCTRPTCEPCDHGYPWRWHMYLSAYVTATAEHVLFECTAQAAEAFTAYRAANGTLRGCLFQATRVNDKPNARVTIQTKPADLARLQLPEPPRLEALLCHIWSIPDDSLTPARDGDGRINYLAAIPYGATTHHEAHPGGNGGPKPHRPTPA